MTTTKTTDAAETINYLNDAFGDAHTKAARRRLVARAAAELGYPLTLSATTEGGDPLRVFLQTPTDARVWAESASNRESWFVRA